MRKCLNKRRAINFIFHQKKLMRNLIFHIILLLYFELQINSSMLFAVYYNYNNDEESHYRTTI